MIRWRTILLGVVIVLTVTIIQGPLAHVPLDDLLNLLASKENGLPNILTAFLMSTTFIVGTFFIITLLYYLFFARGRSFREILRIEKIRQADQVEAARHDKQKEMPVNWKLISLIILAEFILIFVGSFIFSAVQTSRFSAMNYKKYAFGSYQSFSPDVPMYYSFVMVKSDPKGRPEREVYFASVGNITTISYKDGKWISSGGGMAVAPVVFVVAAFLWIGLRMIAKFIIWFSRSEHKSEKAKRLMSYGFHIMIATIPVMMVTSVLGHLVDIALHSFR